MRLPRSHSDDVIILFLEGLACSLIPIPEEQAGASCTAMVCAKRHINSTETALGASHQYKSCIHAYLRAYRQTTLAGT